MWLTHDVGVLQGGVGESGLPCCVRDLMDRGVSLDNGPCVCVCDCVVFHTAIATIVGSSSKLQSAKGILSAGELGMQHKCSTMHTHACTHAHTHTSTHTWAHARTHTHTRTHTHSHSTHGTHKHISSVKLPLGSDKMAALLLPCTLLQCLSKQTQTHTWHTTRTHTCRNTVLLTTHMV